MVYIGWEWWILFVIPASQEAEIRRIMVWGQIAQKVSKAPSQPKS
jgi:hypothetical protein